MGDVGGRAAVVGVWVVVVGLVVVEGEVLDAAAGLVVVEGEVVVVDVALAAC